MAGYKAGRQCKVYIDVDNTYTPLGIAKNPSLALTRDRAEVSDQSSDYKRYVSGLIDVPLTIEINRKIGDTQYKALRDAFLDGSGVQIAVCSGDITKDGEEYFEAGWLVADFPIEAPIDGSSTISMTLVMDANSSVTPGFVDVTE